jgi:hypothetical protein
MIKFTVDINRYREILGRQGLRGEYQCPPQGVTPGLDGGWHDVNIAPGMGELFFRLISLYCWFVDE